MRPRTRPPLLTYLLTLCCDMLRHVLPCARDMCNVCCFDICMCLVNGAASPMICCV